MPTGFNFFLTYLLVIACLASCSSSSPTSFWKEFQPDDLKENISDQGPLGGHMAMHWKASGQNSFTSNQLIDFATKNDWEFADSSYYSADSIRHWVYFGKNIFPLTHEGFNPSVDFMVSSFDDFPRWTTTGLSVLAFRTGLVSIQPGTDDVNDVSGFVTISDDKKEVSVYHLWGE